MFCIKYNYIILHNFMVIVDEKSVRILLITLNSLPLNLLILMRNSPQNELKTKLNQISNKIMTDNILEHGEFYLPLAESSLFVPLTEIILEGVSAAEIVGNFL